MSKILVLKISEASEAEGEAFKGFIDVVALLGKYVGQAKEKIDHPEISKENFVC